MPYGIRVGGDNDERGGRESGAGAARRGIAMLSVPTLWIVFIVNFCALGLVWGYVMRSYPKFTAAPYWTAAALVAAVGAGLGVMRGLVDSRAPLVLSSLLLIFACCLLFHGLQRFYGKPVSWRSTIWILCCSIAGLTVFVTIYDDVSARIIVYSLGQSAPIVLALRLLIARPGERATPGARLASFVAMLMIAVYVVRCVAAILEIGGEATVIQFNSFQAALVLILVFLSMMWNFGFLLMAIDRLRAEVADLALLDDLTGISNRRHLQQRLTAESMMAQQNSDVFSILVIDLDGFKAINDQHGHAAGDECLRMFTRAAQSRLRPRDLLSRIGGDEFCIVLPATTQREAAMIARHVLETCRAQVPLYAGAAISASIGVAQWHAAIGSDTERLVAAADEALYAAKSKGKNRFAIFDHAPRGMEPALRQSA